MGGSKARGTQAKAIGAQTANPEAAPAPACHEFNIHGHKVQFPHQPYGVQLSFMHHMLKTLSDKVSNILAQIRLTLLCKPH